MAPVLTRCALLAAVAATMIVLAAPPVSAGGVRGSAVASHAGGHDSDPVPPIFATVLNVPAWKAAVASGMPYAPPNFAKLGFIHCSRNNQTAWVLNRFYASNTTAPTAIIDSSKLTSPVEMIHSVPGMAAFPHIFGKLNLEAVVHVADLNRTTPTWQYATVCAELGGC